MNIAIIVAYFFCLSFVLVYALAQLYLVVLYTRRKKPPKMNWENGRTFPHVTVQLPIFNEKYVIARLIEAVTKFDYPKDKLEIQILDDSTDETVELVAGIVTKLQGQGFDIQHITRSKNIDYKAGALHHGMQTAKGDYMVIFDADFVPKPHFLKTTLPYFDNPKIGMVQSRWGHLNLHYSLITKLQAYALNAHFTVEQGGRNAFGHFINFNGTAGIWRREAITESGGWQGDTLTEDLDLSYRAQLDGWKFIFLEDLVSPAELPAEMNALKSQQFRWAKGPAQCVRKNLGNVLKASTVSLSTKLNAVFHLLNSFSWLCVYGSGLLLPPFLYVMHSDPSLQPLGAIFNVFHISFFGLMIFYIIANRGLILKTWKDYLAFAFHYPAFISLSMGISLFNASGVVEGYLGKQSSFVRTPKFNLVDKADRIKGKAYIKTRFNLISVLELLSFFYVLGGVWLSIELQQYMATPFLAMMAIGFGVVFVMSYITLPRSKNIT
ncbi:MAG: cellulose synthase family protein [Bacteroidia bacterium]